MIPRAAGTGRRIAGNSIEGRAQPGRFTRAIVTWTTASPAYADGMLLCCSGDGCGDRYMIGREEGFYSHKPEEGRQVTLFEVETLIALKRDARIELGPEDHRRNVTVEGVPLNHLVGRRFWLGETLLEATRLSIPCRHIEEITGKAIFDPLINRSGLNCRILKGGVVKVGDTVRNA